MERVYIPYSDDVEVRQSNEEHTIKEIIETMQREGDTTRERYGHAVRTSHAKSHGLVKGELRVLDDLAPELRQGLFAEPRIYPVMVRLAHVPGELLDDRRVSTPRGMAIKVLGVQGTMLPNHEDEVTQDFVLDTGKVFPSPNAKAFLATITAIQKVSPGHETLKQTVSATSRATNAVLNAVGLNSSNLDFFGHPPYHPVAEAYYSQVPIRYGDYIAKLSVTPVTPELKEIVGEKLDMDDDENALRTHVVEYFRGSPAEYEIGIQLNTDLDKMPIENADKEWPEDDSPYQPVARLVLPAQDAFSPARRDYVEETLSFCPAHSLAAHRLLGSIGRARLKAYEVMGTLRREQNGAPLREPRNIDELPD